MPGTCLPGDAGTDVIATLTIATRVPMAAAHVTGAADALLIGGRTSTTIVGLDGALRGKLDAVVQVALPCGDDCLGVTWSHDALRAVALPDGRERWASNAVAAGSVVRLVCARVVGRSLVIELDWAPEAGVVAQRQWLVLDRASGALRFRLDRADDRWLCPWPRAPSSGDAIVYRTASGGVGLADASSGRVRWQVDQPGATADFVLADDRGVTVAGSFGPVVGLGGADGRIRFAHDLSGRQVAAVALDGDRVWVLTRSGKSRERGVDHPALAWIDRERGDLHRVAPWPTVTGGAPAARAGSDDVGLWPGGGAILVTAGDGILRALRRADGISLWSWGIGTGAQVTLAGAPGKIRPVVAVGGEVWIFGPGPASPAVEVAIQGRVTIGNQPAAGATVVIGDGMVRTDEAGDYRVRVRGRGHLAIHASSACIDGAHAFDGTTEVVLGSAASIHADVAAVTDDCE